MSTLAKIEAVIPLLNPKELSELERLVRSARRRQAGGVRRSALDLPPLQLGKVLRPLSAEDDLLAEMLHDARF